MRTSSALLLSSSGILTLFIFGAIHSSASGPSGLRPVSANPALPSTLSGIKSSIPSESAAPPIDENVWQQIQALLEEKEARSPAQQKIDSQLLYAIRMHRGEVLARNVQSLRVDVGADESGIVTVDISAIVDDELLDSLRGKVVEVSNVFPRYNSLRAVVSLEQLETIASLPQVRFIQPKQEALFSQMPRVQAPLSYSKSVVQESPQSYAELSRAARVRNSMNNVLSSGRVPRSPLAIGSVTSQGDTTHKAFISRGTFNVDGSGIKIGVLSDGVSSLAVSQGTGDLGAVTVLPGQQGFGDEGTAMLEIIHDLAPGAQLYFATAGNGLPSFAQNIRDLRTAGCDIILDDVGYFVESPFQDGQTAAVVSPNNAGLATQAVNDVVASGALYFSSAANSGNFNDGTSGTWEGDFDNGGPLPLLPGGNVHDFDPGLAVSQSDTITGDGILTNLHWSDPLGASGNDYDLFIINDAGTAVIGSSTNIQSGTQDPYEAIFLAPSNYRVVILQKPAAANRFLHLSTNRGELALSTQGETHGHNAASGAYGVAAVCAVCTFPSVFSSTDTVETFSSDGPRKIFFAGDGATITPGNVSSTGGSILQQPLITAADGAAVSGAGGFPSLFYGTSAAAPHAAAIAALIKSAKPSLTPAEIKTTLTSTAIDIEGAGIDRDSGAGIAMPFPALQSLGAPVVGKAFLDLSTVSKTEACCNNDTFIDPGETGTLNVSLNNFGLQDATSGSATLTTSTPGVAIVNGASAYPNITALNGIAVNTTPFAFSLAAAMSQDPEVSFTLTINYSGGHQASQSWNFTVQLGHQLIVNGSFETGDFSGWHVSTVATGGSGTPFQPWSVTPAGFGGFLEYQIVQTSPQHGTHDAWNGFDGGGPMEFRMYQDISIPNGVSLNISWRDRAQWNFCCALQTQPRTYQVQLRNPSTNAILTTLYSFSTGTEDFYHDTGWLTHSHDVSAFSGQTVRLFFLEIIPESFTGPAQIEFDSISSSNGPPPTPTPTPTPGPIVTQLYGGTRNGQLITLNLSTGAGTLVGSLPGPGSTEIEFNNNTRRAFTQFPDGFFSGQEFDITTGAATDIGIADGGSFTGLEWVGSSLYGTRITSPASASDLRILDPATGETTPIGATGITNPIAGLAYDESNATMYGITGGASGGSSNLVTVNLTTGLATMIGPVGFNGGSLEFGPDGNLYAGSTGNTGNLYRINNATGASTLIGPTGFANVTGLALVVAPVVLPNTVRFNASTVAVTETLGATTKVDLIVTRIGTTIGEATVDYVSSDGTASARSDYLKVAGTLRFAANENSKTITAFINDDRFGETPETFNLTLSNPVGCTLGSPAAVVVTINSNEAVDGPNPVNEASFNTDFFVRQHYTDFFNREADPSGLAFWKNQIDECTTAVCRELRKLNVSAAFFLSIEFQQTGYLVYKANQAAYNSHEFLKLQDFLPDLQEIGRGVVIGEPGADARLETNKQKFFLDFVQRPKFRSAAAFPTSMPAEQFVEKLNANTYDPRTTVSGGVLTPGERNELIGQLAANPTSATLRAQVLRSLCEKTLFHTRQFSNAFVLMQYFGYLRRNPYDSPEPTLNYDGYNFWLKKLNDFDGNFVNAEMVKAFIISTEYGQRFGP